MNRCFAYQDAEAVASEHAPQAPAQQADGPPVEYAQTRRFFAFVENTTPPPPKPFEHKTQFSELAVPDEGDTEELDVVANLSAWAHKTNV